ncbi:DUF481 domain-containing protein [Thiohalobacter sp. IOR34]|uniref:DUF481 domain-containing protein n=1 Tax=Thiohalobacter sp. IOR34 TaxID=3057176 RepID=UPI0025AEDDBE|nr:DUF481 domain-containing protein [Thiohalobacter sp. IOR34]WJW75249.1 DUF481 domain-containing protein [Thiohalobacter sp. IOR34]
MAVPRRPLAWLLTALLGLCRPALADEILLLNGDRLSGTIVAKRGNTLTLDTRYAGRLQIQWSSVRQILCSRPLRIVLEDDTRLTGSLLQTEPGKLRIRAGRLVETTPIDLAQVRYINPPVEADGGVAFSGKLNLGINFTKGNTDVEKTHFDAELVAKTLENRYTIGAILNRSAERGTETESNATGYAKYDHFLNSHWYVYSNALFARDRFKDLKLRTSLGLGSGYQFIESKPTNLSLEGGLTYLNEDFYTARDESYPSARWSLNFDHRLQASKLQFFHFHEGYLGLEDTSDLLIRSQTGLRMPLIERLNATAQFDYDWDSTPADGNDKGDARYSLNIGYYW